MRQCVFRFVQGVSLSVNSARFRRPAAGVLAMAFAGLAAVVTSGHTGPHAHDMTLARARVSDSSGRLVVNLDARGELRGMVTLTLSVGSDGTITGGDWAFVVAHLEDLNPDGTVVLEPHDHDMLEPHDESSGEPLEEQHPEGEPHQEYIRFVNKGTLGGEVVGGFVGAGTGGALSLVNVQLQLTSTSLTFAAKTSGNGSIDADLGRDGAQGSLRLNF